MARYDTSRPGWRSAWTKVSTARLLRCSWEAADAIVTRVMADHIDEARLDRLYRIGVDEISYKRGRKFLTIVADHDTGNVVWAGEKIPQGGICPDPFPVIKWTIEGVESVYRAEAARDWRRARFAVRVGRLAGSGSEGENRDPRTCRPAGGRMSS